MNWRESNYKLVNDSARRLILTSLGFLILLADAPAFGGTVIIANRSPHVIRFAVADTEGNWRSLKLKPQELIPIPVVGPTKCRLRAGAELRPYDLKPDSIYLGRATEETDARLQQVVFGSGTDASGRAVSATGQGGADWSVARKPGVIRVKILVDENDVRRHSIRHAKLKQRIEVASQVLEYYCHTRLEIQGYDRWVTDESIKDFDSALAQFEEEVDPGDADLALGFTSQFAVDRKMPHAGGIRGPMRSHILIRDSGLTASEKGRLEFLLHELGHFLGAAHSPSSNTLMRPVLGDGKVNRRGFSLAYDPYNALAMNIVAEQWRRHDVRSIASFDRETRRQLADIYSVMSRFYTGDDAALRLMLQVGGSAEYAARALRDTILRVARTNQRRATTDKKPFAGDDLMAVYVRTAADFANKLPERYAQRTFLLGLAISLDRNGVIGRFSPVARRIESSESLGARQDRLSILGRPTIRGRTDLAAHFLGSSVLTMTIGARQAETAGLLKELADARGGSGFSNADMTANLAGIEFAKAVLDNELSLQAIARSFHPTLYVPTVTPLDEGLKWADVVKKYGHPASPRFHSHLKSLRGRVLGSQGFRGLTNAKADSQVPISGGVPNSGARAFEDPRERYRRK